MGKKEEIPRHHARNLALRYLSYRSRSIQETGDYLAAKKVPDIVIQETLSFLITHHYLDDARFAEQFVASRKTRSPKSRYALGYELKQKGIPPEFIETALSRVDDLEMAWRAVKTRTRKWQGLEPDALKAKLMNLLRYRGFNYDVCRSVWEKFRQTPP